MPNPPANSGFFVNPDTKEAGEVDAGAAAVAGGRVGGGGIAASSGSLMAAASGLNDK
jgi:hypothetical protein